MPENNDKSSKFSSKPTREEVERILKATNWDDYWKRGDEKIAEQVDAYASARAKSLEGAGQRVFL